jgi:hypothetical protein
MDPIATTIVSALVGGAIAALNGIASKAVRDAYDSLKALIAERYKRKATIEAVEEDPTSETQQKAAAEALQKSGALSDEDVLKTAHALAIALTNLPSGQAAALGLDMERFKAASVQIRNVISTGTAVRLRDVEVKGDFLTENVHAGVASSEGKGNP